MPDLSANRLSVGNPLKCGKNTDGQDLTRLLPRESTLDGWWTRTPFAYRESNHLSKCTPTFLGICRFYF